MGFRLVIAEKPSVSAAIANVIGSPTVATSTPAAAGPTVSIVPNEMPLSAAAREMRWAGRMRGVTALRVAPEIVAATVTTTRSSTPKSMAIIIVITAVIITATDNLS